MPGKLSGERVCTVNPPVCGDGSPQRDDFQIAHRPLAVSAAQSRSVAHDALAGGGKGGRTGGVVFVVSDVVRLRQIGLAPQVKRPCKRQKP